MSDHNKPQIKKVASLNSQILEYYQKFGQNRDLERYLRLRQNYNKSSSEGSISTPSCASASRVPSRESKSLDQLNFAKGTSSEEVVQLEEEQVIVRKEVSPQKDVDICPPMVQPDIKFKAKSTVDKPKKSYTFNCESNIAISLPFTQTTSMPELVPRPETSTEYSQTDFDEKLNQSIGFEDEAIRHAKSPDNNFKASKRLEWDSLGDVGYEKDVALKKRQSRSMNTLEKLVLKDFFAEQGIEIKFTADGKKVQDHKLSKIQECKPATSTQGAIPKTPRERWRETLESLQHKYTSQSSSFNNTQKNLSKFRKIPSELHSTPKVEILEKFCQTSFIKTQTKEIQVDFSNGGSIRSAADAGSVTSPSSFEYFSHMSKNQEVSDKENISPSTLNIQRERKLRQSAKKLLDKQNSQRINGENETTDLELGVKLLCSLIESKSLNDKQKKSLARKIVTRITKGSLTMSEKSTSTSSVVSKDSLISSAKHATLLENVSGVAKLSNTSSRTDSLRSKPTSDESKNIETSRKVIETSSEISSANNNEKEQNLISSGKNSKDVTSSKSSSDHSAHSTEKLIEKSCKHKETISVVDEKNTTMREWLDPLTMSEIEYNRKKGDPKGVAKSKKIQVRSNNKNTESSGSDNRESNRLMQFVKDEKKSHLKWIENEIERLENLKHLVLTNDSSDKDKTLSETDDIATYSQIKSNNNHKIYSQQPTSRSEVPSEEKIYDGTRLESEVEIVNPTKNYRRVIKKITEKAKNLDGKEGQPVVTTTVSVEEEKRFAKKDYICSEDENSKEERSKLETPQSCASESIRSYAKQRKEEFLENYRKTPIRLYDQPAESDHYSEPKESCIKQRFPTSNAYTSISSSDFFISTDSVSIPISASSSTTTTTHQYDNRVAVGVQTTDSILRTKPIYYTRLTCGCTNQCECKMIPPTVRVYRPKPNKQVQAHPPSLAYVITFDNSKKSEDSQDSAESLTLQEHLQKQRPDFQRRAFERQTVLKKLHKLRNEREVKIREIVENTSMTSIPRKLRDLPPPPTKYTRIFPTREMKAMTRRKFLKLPEVIEKAERERKERRKRSNKVLADMFNRRLQRRVHKGKLTLEHSRTVI